MLASTSSKNINTLQAFHCLDLSLHYSNSLMEFQLEADLDFSLNMFKSTFIHLVHLLVGMPLGTIFEHLRNIFDPKDLVGDFSQLFSVCSYVVTGCILGNLVKALGATRLLALAKPFGDIRLITIGEYLVQSHKCAT